jgi:hypothetical protein
MIPQSRNSRLPSHADNMSTLSECVNTAVRAGYTDNMKMTKLGLYSCSRDKVYNPAQVEIISFYRFEGPSDPADNSIMFVIETDDGDKGTLIDAYGAYADEHVNKFIAEVEKINKKAKLH